MMSNRDYIRNALLDGAKNLPEIHAWAMQKGAAEDLDSILTGDILGGLKRSKEVSESADGIWQATDDMRKPQQRIFGDTVAKVNKWDAIILPASILAPNAAFECELPEKTLPWDVRQRLSRRAETKDSAWRVESLDDGKVRITKTPNAPSKPNGVVELPEEKKEHPDVLKVNPEPFVDPIIPPRWGSLEFNIDSLESEIKIIDAELAEPKIEAKKVDEAMTKTDSPEPIYEPTSLVEGSPREYVIQLALRIACLRDELDSLETEFNSYLKAS